MHSRQRSSRSSRAPARPPAADKTGLRPLWLGATVALAVAAPMTPSEAAPDGISVVFDLGWLLLLTAFLFGEALSGRLVLRMAWPDWSLAIFVLLHTLSALMMLWSGQPRQTLNLLWHWIALFAAYVLFRHLLIAEAERRAMVAVMLALAVCLSLHGFYQYFVSMPALRAEFEANPTQALTQSGLQIQPGTPQWEQFKNRLYSTEPLSTFTLANSLAGLLAPWLLCSMAIGKLSWHVEAARWRTLAAATLSVLVIGACLMLTKSRTAWLATGIGVLILLVSGDRAARRLNFKFLIGVVTLGCALVAAGLVTGGLDRLVMTESLKSLSYRLQYWQSTLAMIRDHLWFGCGPGNFQQYYTAYKLPEASETIGDPHNFLLEIWATSGTPAALAFISIFVVFAWGAIRRVRKVVAVDAAGQTTSSHDADNALPHVWPMYWGALAGVPIGMGMGFLVGHVPGGSDWWLLWPAWWLVGGAVIALWHAWVGAGRLGLVVLIACVAVALLNLSAAGGISFAGVSLTLWLLVALSLNEEPGASRVLALRGVRGIALAGAAGVLLLAFLKTTFEPVLNLQSSLMQAEIMTARSQLAEADQLLQAATARDTYSDRAWSELARVRLARWLASRAPTDERGFEEAIQQRLRRNLRSAAAHVEAGLLYLRAYGESGDRSQLAKAEQLFGRAVELYPNHASSRAQWAWTLHLMGEEVQAAQVAAEALRLDDLNPHQEQKLGNQRVYDPDVSNANQPSVVGGATAEHLMRLLRSEGRP